MARLGDICEIVSGTTPKSNIPEYWDGEINWVTPAELDDDSKIICESQRKITKQAVKDSSLKSFPAGTVLLTSRAPIGKVAIAGVEMYCNQGFKNLICSEKIHNNYLFWFLKSKTQFLNSLGRGATFKEISKAIIENIEIPLPPKEEQYYIATLLDKLTTLISLRKQQLAKLDELVKARFVEMFGEPGQDPNNWGLKSLGECCILNPSKNQNKRLNSNLMVSFVPMSSVLENGNIDVTDIREYQKVRNGFTYFAENDVLFAKITPCMENGKGAIAQGLYNGIGFGSTEFHVLRPIEKKSNSYWLYALTTSEKFRMEAASKMTGSAGQRRVPALFLENYKVCLPPIILQNQFETFVRSINALKLTIRLCVDKMEVLKNSLMQKFFGQQGEYI